MSSASIFISYRRSTNAAVAGRLHDNLAKHFGTEEVFLDVDTIAPGRNFVEELDERVSKCTIFLAVIGPDWLKLKNSQDKPRLFDPNDYVHIELKGALERGIHVVPILVDGAVLPLEDQLPEALKPLAQRQAVDLSHDRFVDEVETLAGSLQSYLIEREPQKLKPYELFFALNGRIARKEYWKAIVILYAVAFLFSLVFLLISISVLYSATNDLETALERTSEISEFKHFGSKLFLFLISIPLIYVHTAIYSKRLHDMNLGFKTLMVILLYGLVAFFLFLFGVISTDGFDTATLFSMMIVALVGVIPGTKGPNTYGPDPLGGRRPV